MNLTSNEKEALTALKNTLKQSYRLLDLKLYGSKAKDIDSKESDLDILIVTDKINWPTEKAIYEICFEISLKYDVFLSPVIFSEKDTKDRFIRATPFYQNIQKEGIPI